MRSPWPRGLPTHSTVHPWLLMTWAVLLFPFLYGLLPLGGGLGRALIVGFSFFNPLFCSFLQSYYHFLLHYSVIPAVLLFDPRLLDFFEPNAYSSLYDSVWSLGFLLHCLRASVSHLFSLGHLWPIYFPWASLILSNSTFPWTFTKLQNYKLLIQAYYQTMYVRNMKIN